MYLAADNRTLASGGIDGTITLWDIPTQKSVMILKGFEDDLRTVRLSADLSYVAGTTFGGVFKIWNLKSEGSPRMLTLDLDRVQNFAFTPDNKAVVIAECGGRSKALSLWDSEYRQGGSAIDRSGDRHEQHGGFPRTAASSSCVPMWTSRSASGT